MKKKPATNRKRSKQALRLATAAAVGTGAATAHGAIQFYNLDITLGDGDTWYLEGLGGSTALADVFLSSYVTTYTSTFTTTTTGGSTITYTYTYTYTNRYGSFPADNNNSFRFADSSNEDVRALNTTQSISAALFTGAGDGRFVSWFPNSSGQNANWDWSNWVIGQEGFAGFRFNHPTEGLVYGWVKVTIEPDLNGVRLNTWAYEDSGTPLPVGAIPEPATGGLAALAAGVVGLREYRRRRRAKSSG